MPVLLESLLQNRGGKDEISMHRIPLNTKKILKCMHTSVSHCNTWECKEVAPADVMELKHKSFLIQ